MWLLRGLFYTVLLCGALLVAGAGYYSKKCFDYRVPQNTTVILPKGASVRSIGYTLEGARVIRDQFVFEIYLRATDRAAGLKAGEYEFAAGETLSGVIDKILSGKVVLRQLTVPEGFAIQDICRLLVAEKKLMDAAACDRQARDTTGVPLAAGQPSLEGFLFPETYSYDAQTPPEALFRAMTEMFVRKVGADRLAQAQAAGLSPLKLVTLASVVEKETGQAAERPQIAGVFFNRLARGMPLQSDPTVIYGIKNFNGNLTRADLERDTPYNTYTRPELPAGPICSPGLGAIDAVLHPDKTAALYFVAKGNGAHYFSATLEEHNRAVRYYQRHEGSPP